MTNLRILTLDQCCTIVSGATPKTSVDKYWDGDICWTTPKDLSNLETHYLEDTPRKITKLGLANCSASMLPSGSVLFSSRAPIGHVAINAVPMATNQGFKSFIPKAGILDAKFLLHWLRKNRAYLESLGNGATFKEVSKATVARIEIALPSIADQRRIAAILDQADALRAKRREALAQLNCLQQSIFTEMFGDLSTNSKGWKTCTVGDVADCIVPGRDKPKSFSGDTPWVTTADLKHLELTLGSSKKIGLSDTEIKDVRARVIPTGSVIISCVGDLGIVSIAGIPMVVNQQLHSFQCHSNLNNIFLMYCLTFQKPFMLAKASSTTLPYMNKTVCNSIPVVIPPLALQQSFAVRIQLIEAIKSTHQSSLTQLDTLFASLQHRAFQGEL